MEKLLSLGQLGNSVQAGWLPVYNTGILTTLAAKRLAEAYSIDCYGRII